MTDVDAMWFCPDCRTWNGTKLPRCLGCKRERPRIPVTVDDVDVDDARRVTTRDRLVTKAKKLVS